MFFVPLPPLVVPATSFLLFCSLFCLLVPQLRPTGIARKILDVSFMMFHALQKLQGLQSMNSVLTEKISIVVRKRTHPPKLELHPWTGASKKGILCDVPSQSVEKTMVLDFLWIIFSLKASRDQRRMRPPILFFYLFEP